MIVSLAAMVWWTAHALNRADAVRRETETQLRNLAESMDHAYEPLIVREAGRRHPRLEPRRRGALRLVRRRGAGPA